MLHCCDGSFYAGITSNVEARVFQHNAGADGKTSYTFRRRPVKLVFATLYYDVVQAIQFEKQLKGWSRAKKLALAQGDYELLKRLARRNGSQHADGEAQHDSATQCHPELVEG
jgi:putative endonuclease